MSLVDCCVKEVKGAPVLKSGRWYVPVTYEAWEAVGSIEIMLSTETEAKKVAPGYLFLA